ncbi:MAG: hypothetical protein KF704_03120 [Crocinitomicaceae bacterium]|nr:hypothetical protein [Crocinitomicaceae bacterium]
MKTIVKITPISYFIVKTGFMVREEIEHYSDGTDSVVVATYYLNNRV